MQSFTISLVSLAALTTLTAAQTSTLTLYVPGVAESQTLVGSIAGADESATTYILDCPSVTDTSDCGIMGPITLTEGPTTAKYTIPAAIDPNGSVAFTGFIDCSLAGSTSAVCIESFGGTEVVSPGKSTATYTGSDQAYMPVTITARAKGISSVAAPAPTTTVVSTTAAPGASGDGDGDGDGPEKTSDPDGGTEATVTGDGAGTTTVSGVATGTSGAQGVQGTVRNGWVLGGAAAVVAVALL